MVFNFLAIFYVSSTLYKVNLLQILLSWIRIRIWKAAGSWSGSALKRTAGSGSGYVKNVCGSPALVSSSWNIYPYFKSLWCVQVDFCPDCGTLLPPLRSQGDVSCLGRTNHLNVLVLQIWVRYSLSRSVVEPVQSWPAPVPAIGSRFLQITTIL